MGLSISLIDERGEIIDTVEVVYDIANILHRILPSSNDKSYQLIKFIDWYGDTYFNRIQMEVFIDEWKTLYKLAKEKEEKELLEKIENIAQACLKEPHLYVKFSGD